MERRVIYGDMVGILTSYLYFIFYNNQGFIINRGIFFI
jgi:hypothetical protein